MKAFETFTGLVAAMNRVDVDTDQIIPKQFLKRVERTGFGQFLFNDWRFDENNNLRPNFELNQARFKGAQILLVGHNFGCGSSREHAPWALQDFGFDVIIAPYFADIFKTNCYSNGLLPIELDESEVNEFFNRIEANEGYSIKVDLDEQTLEGSDGFSVSFNIPEFRRHCLINGLDDIGLCMEHADKITAYEQTNHQPWRAAVAVPE
jgi:3-isopropylmalate/(R)-2-methylmalate dehydratase small subunit